MISTDTINPFVDATVDTFSTMCGVEPQREGDLDVRVGMQPTFDLVGIIGLSGSSRGAIMLTMPCEVGCKLVGAFLDEEIVEVDSEVMDAYGELLNIIAGGAAANLPDQTMNLAIPTVMMGEDQQVSSKESTPWVVIPMSFPDWGKFNIEVSMEEA